MHEPPRKVFEFGKDLEFFYPILSNILNTERLLRRRIANLVGSSRVYGEFLSSSKRSLSVHNTHTDREGIVLQALDAMNVFLKEVCVEHGIIHAEAMRSTTSGMVLCSAAYCENDKTEEFHQESSSFCFPLQVTFSLPGLPPTVWNLPGFAQLRFVGRRWACQDECGTAEW